MYVVLSAATSIDGFIDDATPDRLLLSSDEDLDRVDALRAECDAILVGATTIRRDDPRLLVRSAARRAVRVAAGRAESPTRVTVTARGGLPVDARFFTAGSTDRLVYCASTVCAGEQVRLDGLATVVDAGDPPDLGRIVDDLAGRGVRRLLVEGGTSVLTQFLVDDLVDELQLAVAPFFVGDDRAPRLTGDGDYPWQASGRRARVLGVSALGDVVVTRYGLSERAPW